MVSKVRRLAVIDEEVQERFDVDTRYLPLGAYEGDQKEIDDDTYLDEWGTTWHKAGDGHYLYVDGPFFGIKRPEVSALDDIDWPDPDNPGYYRGLAERAAALRRETDCAIILNLPVGIVHQTQFVRGFADSLKDLYRNRDFAQALMERICDWWVAVAANALDAVGDNVDITFFGDDLATQQGPVFDPEIYRQMIKPLHRRKIETIREHAAGDIKVLYHSCGSVASLVDDIIEIGVDVLNPVQVQADHMEPEGLKAGFGDRLAFWGAMNTQRVLPFGSPEEVRAEVRRMIDILGKGGGTVPNGVHNIQNDGPAENVVAMFDEARTYVPSWQ